MQMSKKENYVLKHLLLCFKKMNENTIITPNDTLSPLESANWIELFSNKSYWSNQLNRWQSSYEHQMIKISKSV
jgi:hypothetical protein